MAVREYRWRHLALLITILLLFVTAPFVVSLHDGILIMNVISVTVLIAGSYALSERKYLFAIAVVLSAITIAGTALVLTFQQPWTKLVSSSSIVVLVAATLLQLRHTDDNGLRRHRSTFTFGADDGCSGSRDGTVLPGGVDRASGRVAHRA